MFCFFLFALSLSCSAPSIIPVTLFRLRVVFICRFRDPPMRRDWSEAIPARSKFAYVSSLCDADLAACFFGTDCLSTGGTSLSLCRRGRGRTLTTMPRERMLLFATAKRYRKFAGWEYIAAYRGSRERVKRCDRVFFLSVHGRLTQWRVYKLANGFLAP